MHRTAIVAAIHREVSALVKGCTRAEREYQGRRFTFFERDEMVLVCGGIGMEAARRAAEAVIALYHPALVQSVGFAGALQANLGVGDIFTPAVVVDARDGSRTKIAAGTGTLVTFMAVADTPQKSALAKAYGAQAVDMEAAAVAAAAAAHGIPFTATKVISDGLHFEMPELSRFIDSQGQFNTVGFAAFVVLRPWLWRSVVTLANNSSKAARSLSDYLQHSRRSANDAVEANIT
jgi:adenosylhomocysteine nucleosidase